MSGIQSNQLLTKMRMTLPDMTRILIVAVWTGKINSGHIWSWQVFVYCTLPLCSPRSQTRDRWRNDPTVDIEKQHLITRSAVRSMNWTELNCTKWKANLSENGLHWCSVHVRKALSMERGSGSGRRANKPSSELDCQKHGWTVDVYRDLADLVLMGLHSATLVRFAIRRKRPP
jgi:hypothetical protein